MDLFQNLLNRVSRGYGQVDKNVFGGFLPGGAASAVNPIKQKAQSTAANTTRVLAGAAMNQLPDRANLFARYVTGVGNTNLQLEPSTLMSLRAAATKPPLATGMIPNPFKVPEEVLVGMKQQLTKSHSDTVNSPLGKLITETIAKGERNKDLPDFVRGPVPAYGPGLVSSGPVIPYGRSDVGTNVTNTLGSYNVQVNPGQSITFKDTYDMTNPDEDPDLISGKFQPFKAIEEIQSIWDPTKGYLGGKRFGGPFSPPQPDRKYGEMPEAKSQVASPATALGRALLYALPIKPQPYDINVTIPY
jgi:hypothetical protein